MLNLQVNRNRKGGFVCHRIGNRDFPVISLSFQVLGREASLDCRNEASVLASLWTLDKDSL